MSRPPEPTDRTEPTWWSWSTIISEAHRLGVPHFQRGAVWEPSNRVALLESIYERSPCGTFVLWRSGPAEDGREPGVPLCGRFAEGDDPLWLVDGQQRCRTMVRVFGELVRAAPQAAGWSLVRQEDLVALAQQAPDIAAWGGELAADSDDEEDEGGGEGGVPERGHRQPPVWFVVLPAMTAFEEEGASLFGALSDARSVRRGAAFRRVRPPARRPAASTDPSGASRVSDRTLPPMALGAVPLAALLSQASVFARPQARAELRGLLEALLGGASDAGLLSRLDELAPWGPLFLTGHAFDRAGDGTATTAPLRWSDVDKARTGGESQPAEKTLLRALAELCADRWAPALDRFRAMWEAPCFAVGTLPRTDISGAIDTYVRINRAGVRVRVEERALALLSRARPALSADLSRYHERRGDDRAEGDGRGLLAHTGDRALGFAVWMTTVTRYTALSVMGTMGRLWLECAAVDKAELSYRLGRVRGPAPGGAPEEDRDMGRAMLARRDYRDASELIEECVGRATAALLLIDRVLSEELHLDHRMARPAVRGLLPLIELLYFVPTDELERVAEDAGLRAALGRMLHWTLLAPYLNQGQLEGLVKELHGVTEGKGASAVTAEAAATSAAPVEPARAGKGTASMAASSSGRAVPCWPERGPALDARLRGALRTWRDGLLALWRAKDWYGQLGQGEPPAALGGAARETLDALSRAWFEKSVGEARSLQSPAVGWLYALERRGGARELSWVAQVEAHANDKRRGLPGASKAAAEALRSGAAPLHGTTDPALYPEKQHIVPFSVARVITGAPGSRATASAANVIGNLTWLSHRQNHFEALGDRWSVFDPSQEGEEANIAARGMRAPAAGHSDALAVYVYLGKQLGDKRLSALTDADKKTLQGLFDELTAARRSWMVEEMGAWLEAPLSPEAQAWLLLEG